MIAGISEVFYSLQLEGSTIGYPAVFVRFAGCNLRCDFCDTKYALTDGEEMDMETLYEKVSSYHAPRVIFTGGEPALYDNFMGSFMDRYAQYEYFIETNGTLPLHSSIEHFTHVVVSPKLQAIEENVLAHLRDTAKSIEFKFVVKNIRDMDMAFLLSERLKLRPITLQPMHIEGESPESYINRTAELIEIFKRHPFSMQDARLIMQNQKIIYKNKRGV